MDQYPACGRDWTGARQIDELWERRAGRREANLRALNERIARAQEDLPRDVMHIVCECALRDCTDGLDVPVTVFETVRQHEQRFLITPGHMLREIEREVEQGDGWSVVEKHGPAAAGVVEEAR